MCYIKHKEKRMKNNQKGFSVLEILVVVLIVGLIGTIGWLIYDRQNAKTHEDQPKNSSAQKEETPKQEEPKATDETANWKEEKNTEFGFSYKYPSDNGWKTFLLKADSQRYQAGERINNAGVDYTLCGKNCGLVFSFGVYIKGSAEDRGPNWAEKQMENNGLYKLSSKQSVNKNGVTGTRWEYSVGDNSAAKIVYYYFSKGNLSYAFVINLNGAIADNIDLTERGEKIMSTFQFIN